MVFQKPILLALKYISHGRRAYTGFFSGRGGGAKQPLRPENPPPMETMDFIDTGGAELQ